MSTTLLKNIIDELNEFSRQINNSQKELKQTNDSISKNEDLLLDSVNWKNKKGGRQGVGSHIKKLNSNIKAFRSASSKIQDNSNIIRLNALDKIKDLREIVDKELDDKKALIVLDLREVGGGTKQVAFTLNNKYIGNIENYILHGKIPDTIGQEDYMTEFVMNEITNIDIMFVKDDNTRSSVAVSGYFKYINKSKLDLSRYQIFKKHDEYSSAKSQIPCLLYALDQYGVDRSSLGEISTYFIPTSKISKICIELGININLVHYKKSKKRTEYYPRNRIEGAEIYQIGTYLNHYFVDEYVNKTGLDLSQLRQDLTGCQMRANSTTINLLMYLHSQGKFKETDNNERNRKLMKEVNDITITEDNKIITNMLSQKEFKKDTKYRYDVLYEHIFAADLESNTESVKHNPFMFCFSQFSEDEELGFDNINSFLDGIISKMDGGKRAVLYFHNLKYDYNVFISLCSNEGKYPITLMKNIVIKDGNLYSASIMYKGTVFILKDSYKLIANPLSKFSSLFGLDNEFNKTGDFVIYELPTLELQKSGKKSVSYKNITSSEVNDNLSASAPNHIRKYLLESRITSVKPDNYSDTPLILIDNRIVIEEAFLDVSDVSPYVSKSCKSIAYYNLFEDYCKQDCKVLKQGIICYDKIMSNIMGNKPLSYLTISSMVDSYIKTNLRCYDGVYLVSGKLREFIAKANHGGRVSTRDSNKWHTLLPVNDFDAVSLYPSAIIRYLEEQGGFPKGRCKNIPNNGIQLTSLDELNSIKGICNYIVEIEFTSDSKYQQIPFVRISDKKSINYTNECKGKRTIIDKITLEDYVNFCDISFKVIKGVYWDQGFTDGSDLKNFINTIFNNRLQAKKDKNIGLSNMLKLIINSIYGKLLLKPSDSNVVILKKSEMGGYMYKNYELIKKIDLVGDNAFITMDSFSGMSHYNMCNVSCSILSMSKRIMNEVMDIANSNKIMILYQDTDSMHIVSDNNQTEVISNLFRAKYGKEIIGQNLGQLHNDFDLGIRTHGRNQIGIENYTLGKKFYYDHVRAEHNTINGDYKYGDHFSVKGIRKASLTIKSEKLGNRTPMELFECMFKGDWVKFDMLTGDQVSFDIKNGLVKSKKEFFRTVKFQGDAYEIQSPDETCIMFNESYKITRVEQCETNIIG